MSLPERVLVDGDDVELASQSEKELMPQKKMDAQPTAQYDFQVPIKGSWKTACCCFSAGVFFCLPFCPLYNVWKNRNLEKKQRIAETRGQRFEINETYAEIARWSLYFAMFLIIWYIASGVICLIDDNCVVLITTSSDS